MTGMIDLNRDDQISARLAVAIGWLAEDVFIDGEAAYILCPSKNTAYGPSSAARPFDYRDPGIIWLIAERYDCFPHRATDGYGNPGQWGAYFDATVDHDGITAYAEADTAAKAVAIAIITGMEMIDEQKSCRR